MNGRDDDDDHHHQQHDLVCSRLYNVALNSIIIMGAVCFWGGHIALRPCDLKTSRFIRILNCAVRKRTYITVYTMRWGSNTSIAWVVQIYEVVDYDREIDEAKDDTIQECSERLLIVLRTHHE